MVPPFVVVVLPVFDKVFPLLVVAVVPDDCPDSDPRDPVVSPLVLPPVRSPLSSAGFTVER